MGDRRGEPRASFSEREFYRREFRGRTLAIALPRPDPESIGALVPVLEELDRGGARCVVVAPAAAPAAGAAAGLERLGAGAAVPGDHPRLEGEVWRALRAGGRACVTPAAPFGPAARDLARRLGVFKLVWLDSGGGLVNAAGRRLPFVHLEELRALLADGGAGLATRERMPLWREIDGMLRDGLPAVNVCAAGELDPELFTYAGAGTLFTRERYVHVRRLVVDDYDAVADLVARGVEEGYLAPRGPEELDRVLARGFGAFVEERDLAGVGALLPLGADAAEIASLYTLTRFLGEGVGVSLVAHALERARAEGRRRVYACTTSEEVGAFFERNGLRPVPADELPAAKWRDYDPARRERVRCYRADV